MSRWYILDNDHNPVATDVLVAAKWIEDNPERRVVKQENILDKNGETVRVSTVFLGLDHGVPWNKDKRPVLWETMIFGGEHDQYQDRYTSYEDALEGHQKAIDFITK